MFFRSANKEFCPSPTPGDELWFVQLRSTFNGFGCSTCSHTVFTVELQPPVSFRMRTLLSGHVPSLFRRHSGCVTNFACAKSSRYPLACIRHSNASHTAHYPWSDHLGCSVSGAKSTTPFVSPTNCVATVNPAIPRQPSMAGSIPLHYERC